MPRACFCGACCHVLPSTSTVRFFCACTCSIPLGFFIKWLELAAIFFNLGEKIEKMPNVHSFSTLGFGCNFYYVFFVKKFLKNKS